MAMPDTEGPVQAGDGDLSLARRLYEAMAERDAAAILATLNPSFRGVVAAGMPGGVGGEHRGAEHMLLDCWARLFDIFDLTPEPHELLPAGPRRLVVIGRCLGSARSSGKPFDAAFAHILRFEEGLISELVQITDTAKWHESLLP
jgi:2-(1,2-epoxy-1,2-dihydrophenyl)acetyl-CoA isomerase